MNATNTIVRHTYSKLIKGMSRILELMHEDIKRVAEYLAAGPATGPLAPSGLLQKEDFKHIKWWEPFQWQVIKSSMEPRDFGVKNPIISLYMEDENGQPIPESTKKALCRDLYRYQNDLYSSGSDDLCPYGELGLDRKDHFQNHFKGSYPWLRLCASHWKVDQLWLSYFHTWKKPLHQTVL